MFGSLQRGKVKWFIYQIKKEVQEQFGRKMNKDVNGNRKLFWKEVSKANGGKGRLVMYNIDPQEQVAVHMYDFDGVRRGNYFGGEPIRIKEVKVRVGKLKNGKDAGKDEVAGEMIKGGGNRVVDWIWRLCNMIF